MEPPRQRKAKSDDLVVSSFEIRVDGWNAYAVSGALVFGFGLSIWGDGIPTFEVYDKSNNQILSQLFGIIMSLAIACAAIGTAIMLLQYYLMKQLISRKPETCENFLEETKNPRKIARMLIQVSYLLVLIALALLAIVAYKIATAIICSIVLVGATIIIFLAERQLKAIYKKYR